jgi:hypothetical protein
MVDAFCPTTDELARLFRAREGYLHGYFDEWDAHSDCHLHVCHLSRRPPLPPRVPLVLRGIAR